jgi:hypothetical protein
MDFLYYLPTLMMHGQTQIRYILCVVLILGINYDCCVVYYYVLKEGYAIFLMIN